MMQHLWKLFPQLLVQKINGLLDAAEPSPTKAFHLYKTCQREQLWQDSFEKFSDHLRDFFSQPKDYRAKSYFDSFLERPMNRHIFDEFQLTFRTANVNARDVVDTANWAHNMMRISCKSESEVISSDVLGRTLQDITNPPPYEKDHDIEFEDFCIAWKKIVFKLFGKTHDSEMNRILKELRWLNAELKKPEVSNFTPSIYLTQTEIDWTTAVKSRAEDYAEIPEFPLSRGAQKIRLMELERAVNLYNIVQKTDLPELLKHRENIRTTILDKCEWLLKEKAR
jgi:hypothetical protein